VSEDTAYLEHILGAAVKAMRYAADGQEWFGQDSRTQDAIFFQLIVIGEATKHLSADLRKLHPEVAWRRMAGMRDVLVHNYMGIDLDFVWSVTQRDLPALDQAVAAILANVRGT
jgi:uncharacterized protein with HEPN domain